MNSNDVTRKTRPGRKQLWQYFLQFRLRTLLVMVTMAALASWWYITPKTIEDQEADGRLLVRRDVLPLERVPPKQRGDYVNPQDVMYRWPEPFFNVGAWELFAVPDTGRELLVRGRYLKNQPHGMWTLYHPNGKPAAQGRMEKGARIGIWRQWNADGQLVSEVSYDQVPVSGYVGINLPPTSIERYRVAVRQGPVQTWHLNEKPHLVGAYQGDEKHGPWKEYDEEGKVVAEGKYSAGHRVGAWRIRDASTGNDQEVVYQATGSR